MLSLILVAVCCQVVPLSHMHDAMQAMAQPFAHTLLLMMNLPDLVSLIAFFILVLVSIAQTTQSPRTLQRYTQQFFYRAYTPPLQLALADGILNPKPY
jgi:Na+/proline symporter